MADSDNIKNSEDNFIPEGLEYREEYWERALEKIIFSEQQERRRRRFFFLTRFALPFLILSGIGFYYFRPLKEPVHADRIASFHASFAIPMSPSVSSMNEQPGHKQAEKNNLSAPTSATAENTSPLRAGAGLSKETSGNTVPGRADNYRPQNETIRSEKPSSTASGIENTSKQKDEAAIENTPVLSGNDPRAENEQPMANEKNSTEQTASETSETSSMYRKITPQPIPSDWDSLSGKLADNQVVSISGKENLPRWNFSMYAGASVVTDFSTPLKDFTLDLLAGAGAEKNINDHFSATMGMEYFSISKVSSPYSQTSIQYDINYQKTITTVETHKLHYFSIPLVVCYRPGKNQQIRLGGGASYMITGNNDIYEYRQTPTTDTLLNQYRDAGFVKGFRDFAFHAEAGYSHKIGQTTWLGLTYQYGLTDITKNAYFSNDQINRNSRLLFYFKMNLR